MQRHGQDFFAVPYNSADDVLYVADDKWNTFCFAPEERMGQPDLIDQNVQLSSDITRIAVSETLFGQKAQIRCLPGIQMWFAHLTVVFVVVGSQPHKSQEPWRWELENTNGGAFIWQAGRGEFTFEHGTESFRDEGLYNRIGEAATTGLRDEIRGEVLQYQGLEVRPVFVTRQ